MEKIKLYFKKNPYMGFAAVILFVTIFLGIGAFIGTRPQDTSKNETLSPTPTEEEPSDSTDDTSATDTTESEHKAIPTSGKNEGGSDAETPTKGPTSAPTATATPAQSKVNINLLGDLYEDKNCNGTRDSDEGAVTKSSTVNIYKMPEFSAYTSVTSDGSGHYSYSGSIGADETLKLQPGPVSPEGYKANPKYTIPTASLTKDHPSERIDVPQVPAANVSACQ